MLDLIDCAVSAYLEGGGDLLYVLEMIQRNGYPTAVINSIILKV